MLAISLIFLHQIIRDTETNEIPDNLEEKESYKKLKREFIFSAVLTVPIMLVSMLSMTELVKSNCPYIPGLY